ncbi:MAG: hypothetical protein NC313_04060 [Butyrivibrio sp.]|nr:hypothetical protein [Butyrivibrio sp.]
MKINHKNTVEISDENMRTYFNDFDSFIHKYFKNSETGIDPAVAEYVMRLFGDGGHYGVNLQEVSEIFQTMDKVYHYGNDKSFEEINLLEQATDKFLVQYVDIDGMQELFRPAFFNFEWMMHLEYVQDKHDYSYYRDHYMHQMRNMYEMFKLLDDKGMWRDCMEIYKQRKNAVANRMTESVAEQQKVLPYRCRKVLKESFSDIEEWCYHYIIFSTAIVSSLVHDIGYTVAYMKRKLKTMQDFLPQSSMFMGMLDGIPKIKSLLSRSLLFETVDNSEIIRRLNVEDHGTYSAIILLCYYYDNGKIFSMEPAKRMIIELSALVIYNHTLKHHFQDEKNYDRYQSVFTDNPISYLFRLCDDAQEWGRVYFEITGKGNFFICDKCKMPMFRRKNIEHHHKNDESGEYGYEYECYNCKTKAINTVMFPYRRMMNVFPFKALVLEEYGMDEKNVRPREEQRWVLELKCDKGELLQLARYNPNFAIQRAKGVRELRGLVSGQTKFPYIFVKAFVTNNPIAIKAEILRDFIQKNRMLQVNMIRKRKHSSLSCNTSQDYFVSIDSIILHYGIVLNNNKMGSHKTSKRIEALFLIDYLDMINKIKKGIAVSCLFETIYDTFYKKCNSFYKKRDFLWKLTKTNEKKIKDMLMPSINFYLFMLIFCNIVCRIEFISEDEENIDDGKDKKKRDNYELKLNEKFTEYAAGIAKVWGISDEETIVLIADCIICMYGNISEEYFFNERRTFRHNLRIPLRADISEILKKYTREPDDTMKKEQIFDFWPNYYFFHMMDYINSEDARK